MCRIAAYFGPPRSARTLFFGGNHSLASQSWAPAELLHGTVNVDGWGLVWHDSEGLGRLTRMAPIWHEPDTPDLLSRIRSGSMMASLRNATPGLPVDASGVAPFAKDGWAFSLNGFVPAFRTRHMRALRSTLSDGGYASITGVSDTETLFLMILEEMSGGVGPIDAMVAVREMVRGRLGPDEEAPLTMALGSAEGLWLLNSSAGGAVNSMYLGAEVEPMGTGVTLASERLSPDGWVAVPPHHAVAVTDDGWSIDPA